MAEGNRMGMFFAYFRQAFAIVNLVTVDKSLFEVETKHPVRIIGPGQITTFLSDS